ncbi:MAG TPA: TIGR00730 family Rossman fold protein [Candidatus Kapabacteria bacterium]|nr:TIGR00730 family Rossman fold protein [Candidatus Kapabacteria bacterium]
MKKKPVKQLKEESSKDFSYQINETGEYRDTWRIFRIMSEFVEGYQFLRSLKKEVTILGSARFPEEHTYYTISRNLGALLAKNGYTTLTGGGPGIMEAGNRGAMDAGGESVGLNIQLPFEQRINPYVKRSIGFYYFFTRKVMLTSPADAFVFFPGGFGTLDEFFEVVDNMDLGKMCPLPIVLVGREYWQPILDFLNISVGGVAPAHRREMAHWRLVDTAEEAMQIIQNSKDIYGKACELSPLNFHGGDKNLDWRIFRIMAELVEGFEFLTGLVEDVTILGTSEITFDNPNYISAYKMGHLLAEQGYSVVTGGSTGVAEAANKGVMEAGGQSIGIAMEVNGKAKVNQYVTKSIIFKFPFTRKLIVTAPSKAFIFYPGGFGTLHHLFEVLTLIQTQKMERVPIILMNSTYWKPLDQFIRSVLATELKTINPDDTAIYTIVDNEEEAVNLVNTFRNKMDTKNMSLTSVGRNTAA